MDTATRKKLPRLALELLAVLGALLLGLSSGCSLSWTPQETKLKILWPDRDIRLHLNTSSTTRPAEEPRR